MNIKSLAAITRFQQSSEICGVGHISDVLRRCICAVRLACKRVSTFAKLSVCKCGSE